LHVYAAVRLPLKLGFFHTEGNRHPGHSYSSWHKLVQYDLQCSLLALVHNHQTLGSFRKSFSAPSVPDFRVGHVLNERMNAVLK